MGTINWYGRTWNVTGNTGGVWIDENGYLHIVRCGAAPSSAELISTNHAEFNGYHVVHSIGMPQTATLMAPIWIAPWNPWEADGEMDIETYPQAALPDNSRYAVWERGHAGTEEDPYEQEWAHGFINAHQALLIRDSIRIYGSAPNYSVEFHTHWWDGGGWQLEETAGYTGPGVTQPADEAHVWLSIFAGDGSSGRDERVYHGYSFTPS